MKRLIAAFLTSVLLLTGCTAGLNNTDKPSEASAENMQDAITAPAVLDIDSDVTDPGDPKFLQYVEDAVYASTEEDLSSDDYVIESVVASHVSKEYLEELDYNSQENIYFGYTLSESEAQFDGAQYVFTLNENGETEAQSFAPYDDTFDQVLKNVAVGSGVILVSVTVSIIAGAMAGPATAAGATATTINTIFVASASAGTATALSSGAFGAIVGGAVTGFQTGDVEAALKSAALAGSEGFKWGAITGVIAGGATKALELRKISKGYGVPSKTTEKPSHRQSEIDAHKAYGGTREVSYYQGKKVDQNLLGSSRLDIVRRHNGRLEAIEVKNYDLENNSNSLKRVLIDQFIARSENLPAGMRQRVLLDARGRGYSKKFMKRIRKELLAELKKIDPKVKVDFWL